MKNHHLFLFLILYAFALHRLSYANDINYSDRYKTQLSLYESILQSQYKEFKLIRELPSETKAAGSMKIDVSTSPQGAVATLHNLKTGKPLMSCVTPCELKGRSKKTYRIVYFKDGYLPSYHLVTPIFRKRIDYPPYKLDPYEKMTEKYDVCASKMSKWMSKDRPNPIACAKRSPTLPARSVRSGICEIAFNVDVTGYPSSILLKKCSEKVFEDKSLTAAAWWRFYPRIENGRAVAAPNVSRDFNYVMKNSKGKVIPAKK